MLFVKTPRTFSGTVKDFGCVTEDSLFRFADIIDCHNGIAADRRIPGSLQQSRSMLYCKGNTPALCKGSGRVGIFRSQDQITGRITLIQQIHGHGGRGIRLGFIDSKGNLNGTKFHTLLLRSPAIIQSLYY